MTGALQVWQGGVDGGQGQDYASSCEWVGWVGVAR
jgi:hypothetical protein